MKTLLTAVSVAGSLLLPSSVAAQHRDPAQPPLTSESFTAQSQGSADELPHPLPPSEMSTNRIAVRECKNLTLPPWLRASERRVQLPRVVNQQPGE